MLQTFLLRSYLFFAGIKFFETSVLPAGLVLASLKTSTVEGQEITFSLYRQNCVKSVYRFGRIRRRNFTGYVVKCDIPGVGAPLFRCSGFKLLFKGSYLDWVSDRKIARLLIQLYMHEMRERMLNEPA